MRGSPSTILLPKFSTINLDTTASNACTMCSIHTMVTPEFLNLPDQLDEFGTFGFGQATGDLVEEEKLGRARQRTRQLKTLASEQVERAGAAVGGTNQSGAFEDVAADVNHLRLALLAAVDPGDQQVFKNGEVFKRLWNLERAADAGDATGPRWRARDIVTVKMDSAGVRLLQSGDKIEQGGFAGAIWPDDAEGLAPRDFKLDAIDGFERAERFCQIFQPQDHATAAQTNAGPHGPAFDIVSPE